MPETDVLTLYRFRREDSDAPNDRYRLYEVAGGAHADGAFYPFQPSVADAEESWQSRIRILRPGRSTTSASRRCCCMKTPINTYVIDAAFANLTRWVRDGVAPPKATRIAVENGGTPQARVVRDQFGNAIGGVRHTLPRCPDCDLRHSDHERRNVLPGAGPHGSVQLGAARERRTARHRTTPPKSRSRSISSSRIAC